MAISKFFNCVDFPVNFRMIWIEGAPRVTLQPGGQIEGPFEILATYNFLRPINPNFTGVSAFVEPSKEELPKDIREDVDQQEALRKKYSAERVVVKLNEILPQFNSTANQEVKPEAQKETKSGKINWVKTPLEEVIRIAKELGVYDENEEKDPKRYKWVLVDRIKPKLKEQKSK